MADYNGWTNYETWAVKLWIDDEQPSSVYWNERAIDVWNETADKTPNQFLDHSANARSLLAAQLKAEHDSESEHPVFAAAANSVYADLLNAALSGVNWHEIASALLESAELDGYETSS